MASTWKEFVEFSMPSSPPTAYVSANLGNASPVGLNLSPYGQSVSSFAILAIFLRVKPS